MRILVVMRASRFADLQESGLFASARSENDQSQKGSRIEFTLVDPLHPTPEPSGAHVLLHKISDYLHSNEAFSHAKKCLELFQQSSSRALIVDPLESVAKTFDRIYLADLLSNLKCTATGGDPKVEPLPFLEIKQGESGLETEAKAREAGVHLPCILKSASACGIAGAHEMSLILKWEGLPAVLQRRSILQSFKNHGGILHKVYVLDEMVHVLRKGSVPDLPQGLDLQKASTSVLKFDSQFGLESWPDGSIAQTSADPAALCEELALETAQRLRESLKLTLFGFDMIVGPEGTHYVIDVNYFPSFKGVPNAHDALCKLLTKLVAGETNNPS